MLTKSGEEAGPALCENSTRLMAERARAGLWILGVANVLLCIRDVVQQSPFAVDLTVVRIVQLLLIGVSIAVLQPTLRRRTQIWIMIFVVASATGISATEALVRGEMAVEPPTVIALLLGAAILLPWGLWPQVVVVAFGVVAVLAPLCLVEGSLDSALTHTGVIAGIILSVSCYVAYVQERCV